MFDLDNIKVSKLYQLGEVEFKKYMQLQSVLGEKDVFPKIKATPLMDLTFGEVATLKNNLAKPTFESLYECFQIVFKVKLKTYVNQSVVDYFYAMNWLKNSVRELMEREAKTLSSDIDPLLDAAGIKRLVKFGELNTLKAIGQQFGKSPREIEDWKYSLVFSLMLHDKVSSEVQKEFNNLKYGSKAKA